VLKKLKRTSLLHHFGQSMLFCFCRIERSNTINEAVVCVLLARLLCWRVYFVVEVELAPIFWTVKFYVLPGGP
jgi:hypothetical protein